MIWQPPRASPITVPAECSRAGSQPTRHAPAAPRGGFFVAEFLGRSHDRLWVRPEAGPQGGAGTPPRPRDGSDAEWEEEKAEEDRNAQTQEATSQEPPQEEEQVASRRIRLQARWRRRSCSSWPRRRSVATRSRIWPGHWGFGPPSTSDCANVSWSWGAAGASPSCRGDTTNIWAPRGCSSAKSSAAVALPRMFAMP